MPLKTDPKYGYYPWWPENGDGWLHPDDVRAARLQIPGPRVFRRDGEDGEFVVLHYGERRLRVRRVMWQEVSAPKFEIGDWVEVLSRGRRNDPQTGTVREMLWDENARDVVYQITVAGNPLEERYTAEDLQRVEDIA